MVRMQMKYRLAHSAHSGFPQRNFHLRSDFIYQIIVRSLLYAILFARFLD